MRATNWSAPTDWETVKRRVAGRNHYNAWRKHLAAYRRHVQVIEVADRLDINLWAWGTCARIARELSVSRSTICRDLKAIKADVGKMKACPVCGHNLGHIFPQMRTIDDIANHELKSHAES